MPVASRPHPAALDLAESAPASQPSSAASCVAGANVRQAALPSPMATMLPTPLQRAGSTGYPSIVMPAGISATPSSTSTAAARQAVLVAGQYPPGVGWTPVAKQLPTQSFGFTRMTPAASPTASAVIAPTSPASAIAVKSAGERAFPPGLGLTPSAAAGATARITTFGMDSGIPMERRPSIVSNGVGVPPTPLRISRAASQKFKEEDGNMAICKELMLILRDSEATAGLSPEEAGFVKPEPGWITTGAAEDFSPTASQKAASPSKAKAKAVPKSTTKPAAKTLATGPDMQTVQQQPDEFQPELAAQVTDAIAPAVPPGVLKKKPARILGTAPSVHAAQATQQQQYQQYQQYQQWEASQRQETVPIVARAAVPTQSLGSQQFVAGSAVRSFGTQQLQGQITSPTQSFAMSPVQSWGQQQYNNQGAAQARYQQVQPAQQEWWSWGENQPWGEGGDAWSWNNQWNDGAQQQSWAGAGAPTQIAGKGKGRSKGKGRGKSKVTY